MQKMTSRPTLLKWPGSKAAHAKKIVDILLAENTFDARYTRSSAYFEPFVGAGHVFLDILARRVLCGGFFISDSNAALIGLWDGIQEMATYSRSSLVEQLRARYREVRTLEEELIRYRSEVARRAMFTSASFESGAWLVYLTSTSYNGLFRVNQAGEMTAPFGRRLFRCEKRIEQLRKLATPEFDSVMPRCGDFAARVREARQGDIVYLDPPYTPKSETANFASYTGDGFGQLDRRRLAETFNSLAKRGVRVALSEADVPEVRARYRGHTFIPMSETRAIASRVSSRARVETVLIVPARRG